MNQILKACFMVLEFAQLGNSLKKYNKVVYMKLINEAHETLEDLVTQQAPEGLLCLDACLCTDPEFCKEHL